MFCASSVIVGEYSKEDVTFHFSFLLGAINGKWRVCIVTVFCLFVLIDENVQHTWGNL